MSSPSTPNFLASRHRQHRHRRRSSRLMLLSHHHSSSPLPLPPTAKLSQFSPFFHFSISSSRVIIITLSLLKPLLLIFRSHLLVFPLTSMTFCQADTCECVRVFSTLFFIPSLDHRFKFPRLDISVIVISPLKLTISVNNDEFKRAFSYTCVKLTLFFHRNQNRTCFELRILLMLKIQNIGVMFECIKITN